MKKTVVLLSILTILCWVPTAFAQTATGDWDGTALQAQTLFQKQGGEILVDGEGSQIGGLMGQDSQMVQEFKAGGIAVSTVDPCIDCQEPGLSLGGGLAVSAMGAYIGQDQHQGQGQIGVYGELGIQKNSKETSTRTVSGIFNEDGKETFDHDVTKSEKEDGSFDLEVTEKETDSGTFNGDVNVDANVAAHADGKVNHTTDNTTADPPANDVDSETWSADGNLTASKHLDAQVNAGYTSNSEDKLVVDADYTKNETKTADITLKETWDSHKDFTMTTTCETTRESSALISGNGVAGMQYGGGYQSGHVAGFAFSAAAGGGIEYQPIVPVRPGQGG